MDGSCSLCSRVPRPVGHTQRRPPSFPAAPCAILSLLPGLGGRLTLGPDPVVLPLGSYVTLGRLFNFSGFSLPCLKTEWRSPSHRSVRGVRAAVHKDHPSQARVKMALTWSQYALPPCRHLLYFHRIAGDLECDSWTRWRAEI